jgi:neutral trehalase
MWRGPVWVNVNWLIAYGFDRYGRHDAADLIRRRTCEEIERRYLEFGTLFEFFDDRCDVDPPQLSRKGRCAPEVSPYHQVFHDYGWTATLYVDMIWSRAADRRDLPRSTP